LGAAEISVSPATLGLLIALQWGRSLGSCGNQRIARHVGTADRASMGPQPWELRKWPSHFILQK
jgi:hypothetical protein